jgi:hypothetical protein
MEKRLMIIGSDLTMTALDGQSFISFPYSKAEEYQPMVDE